MVAPPPGLACDTRFRNGSSVANCVYRLTCCFVSVVDDRTRSRFALVSRSVRMIKGEVRVHYAAGFQYRTGYQRTCPWSSAVPSS